jgi:hypothetical protein
MTTVFEAVLSGMDLSAKECLQAPPFSFPAVHPTQISKNPKSDAAGFVTLCGGNPSTRSGIAPEPG